MNKYSRTADKGIPHQHDIKTTRGNILNNLFVTALIRGVQGTFSSGPQDQVPTYMCSVPMNLLLITVVSRVRVT